tara:strand:- start:1469 stop:1828 length:360 start_codon:yes stop_codon:yes gene_type:complete
MSNNKKDITLHCLNVPFLLTQHIINNLTLDQLNSYPLLAMALKMVYDEKIKNRILILTPKFSSKSFVWISSTRTSLTNTREVSITTIDTTNELNRIQENLFKVNDVKYNGVLITTITCY